MSESDIYLCTLLATLRRTFREVNEDPKIWGTDEPNVHDVLNGLARLEEAVEAYLDSDIEHRAEQARDALNKLLGVL